MKNGRSTIFCLILLWLCVGVACYQPIANTSGGTDSGSGRENRDEITTTEDPEKPDKDLTAVKDPDTDPMNKSDTKTNITQPAEGFRGNLSQNLSRNGLTISDIYDDSSPVENRIFKEYGAVFLTKAMPPTKTMFTSEAEVSAFQTKAGAANANISGSNVTLQPTALKALETAINEAKSQGLSITPRDKKPATDSAKRNYQQTLELWNDRFYKACDYWKGKGRLTGEQISRLKSLPIKQQVAEVLELEKKGIYFSKSLDKSILYSVAAPGTSQHLSMLAFDVTEYGNKKVRDILAKHGWFRTIKSDEPHFTYLGYQESELPKLGLKKDGDFWIPAI